MIVEFEEITSLPLKNKLLESAFNKLCKILEIDASLYDYLYLQPFKMDQVSLTRSGHKNYTSMYTREISTNAGKYCKLVKKTNGELKLVKSFGKVDKLKEELFEQLSLVVRLSQYNRKISDLHSLEIDILHLAKK